MKVLVVDDEEGILEVIKIVLEESGSIVKTVNNASELEASLKQFIPDVVLLDVWMSGANGQDYAKKIKEFNKDIAVVIMTAHHEGAKIAKEANADGFLAKPFDINDLVLTVKKSGKSHKGYEN